MRRLLSTALVLAAASAPLACGDEGTGTDEAPATTVTAPPSGEGGADTEAGDPTGGLGNTESDGDPAGGDGTESGPAEGDETQGNGGSGGGDANESGTP